MKTKPFILTLFAYTLFNTPVILAQALPVAKVGTVEQVFRTVEFSIISDQQFYVGGNRYVLTIGTRSFTIARQTDKDGKGQLVFLIPEQEFKSLPEGGKIYLTYGDILDAEASESAVKDLVESQPNVIKFLGVFNKAMLKQ